MHSPLLLRAVLVAITLSLGLVAGCKSAYYSTWEKLGWEKRDILVDRVEDARSSQNDAKEQIKTTLERFQEVTNFQGGDLEAKYKKLNSAYEDSVDQADEVRGRIKSVETVATDMFKEWRQELKQYTNDELRRSSQDKLQETEDRYEQLIEVMKRAADRMDPVLATFKDQVLFLKHNLNAQAISSLQNTTLEIQNDVATLIAEMEASIREADEFIKDMK